MAAAVELREVTKTFRYRPYTRGTLTLKSALLDALLDEGHFVVYCEHDDGHAMPPMEPPVEGYTTFYALWQFMLDHPYDLPPGDSPYWSSGLPETYPEWCAIAE